MSNINIVSTSVLVDYYNDDAVNLFANVSTGLVNPAMILKHLFAIQSVQWDVKNFGHVFDYCANYHIEFSQYIDSDVEIMALINYLIQQLNAKIYDTKQGVRIVSLKNNWISNNQTYNLDQYDLISIAEKISSELYTDIEINYGTSVFIEGVRQSGSVIKRHSDSALALLKTQNLITINADWINDDDNANRFADEFISIFGHARKELDVQIPYPKYNQLECGDFINYQGFSYIIDQISSDASAIMQVKLIQLV